MGSESHPPNGFSSYRGGGLSSPQCAPVSSLEKSHQERPNQEEPTKGSPGYGVGVPWMRLVCVTAITVVMGSRRNTLAGIMERLSP